MDGLIDRIVAFSERHRRALAALGVVWLAIGTASYARFVTLPDIPLLTDQAAMWISAAFNAIWWGFLNPRIEHRRKERAATTIAGAPNG